MTNCQLPQHPTGSERCVVHCSVGSSWCATVCLRRPIVTAVLKTERQEYRKNDNSLQKCATTNRLPDVMLNNRANQR